MTNPKDVLRKYSGPLSALREVNSPLGDMFRARDAGLCPICKKEVNFTEFRDQLSEKEYGISGMCQRCQDEVFS